MVALTIGMATYNDFDGVYFTLQALRLYQDLADTELVVVDNYGCDTTRDFVTNSAQGRYIRATELVGTAAPRDRIFAEARGQAVLCCDSHILFMPGVIARLKAYHREHPQSIDLLQGPLVLDHLLNVSTHFEPEWRRHMWGTWATDERGRDPEGEPFDIPMQGLGVFSCRRRAWPGFNPAFRGFGGEEGYIHEKFRQRGGRTLCLPWLRWVHRFQRPSGVPYPLSIEDKLRNYLIGHAELGLDLEPVLAHFKRYVRPEAMARVQAEAMQRLEETRAKTPRKPKRRKAPRVADREAAATTRDDADGVVTPALAQAPDEAEFVTPADLDDGTGPPTATASERDLHCQSAVVYTARDAGEIAHAAPSCTMPLPRREALESDVAHMQRVARLVEEAVKAGGTYLLVPTDAADWLGEYPLAGEYFATYHELVAATMETGFLFALRSSHAIATDGGLPGRDAK